MMNLQWILNPLTTYAALAIGLTLALFLYFSLRMEMAQIEQTARGSGSNTASGLETLSAELEKLRETVEGIEQTPAATSAGPAINLTRRAQVLRMHQRGETVSTIAGALRVPQHEIELLLKLHRMTDRCA
jgi:hypothetical protein